MPEVNFKVFRGNSEGGEEVDYKVEVTEGMVVLDAMFQIQQTKAPDLAIRWNCKAAKCGSCSAEINGKPSLMCKTRLDTLDPSKPVTVRPMRAFPIIKDLVTDVSFNYRVNKTIPPFKPKPGTDWKMLQEDVDRAQEFRKCIECFLCQDTCHVLRDHAKHEQFGGPRWLIRAASLEMHPLDVEDRIPMIREKLGIGFCNITKCCTEVCPEEIHITDNAIIPLKERVVDRYYDPIGKLIRIFTGNK
ncbi:MAG: succinate dehydrogenase/fumarate reductase iron-sulfur subunit [Capsulimonadaceae bacterium]|nr:succinate dehydrogenase/fumarate reductase iron-sulfur subunit [Capsulimonadaceae bacterium]